jgi:predicted nucleotidyltransferase
MLEMLIPSQTRVRLLTLFLLNPGTEYYIREIERVTGENFSAIHSELKNLETFGLLSKTRKGKQIFYTVNRGFFLYDELQRIILKTEGVVQVLQDSLKDKVDISRMFIYGSFASGKAGPESDIDLFIVGTIDEDDLIPVVNKAEELLHREINYTLMGEEEFTNRIRNKDPFVSNVMKELKVIIRGDTNE